MYLSTGSQTPPEGFAGPNDHWHYHENVCLITRPDGGLDTPFGADETEVTEAMCTDLGGDWVPVVQNMVHVWAVPGYEHPDNVFGDLNPPHLPGRHLPPAGVEGLGRGRPSAWTPEGSGAAGALGPAGRWSVASAA